MKCIIEGSGSKEDRHEKKYRLLVVLAGITMISGCVLSDITENANDVLAEAEDLLKQIDKQVETGKLTQTVADQLKEVVNSAISTISDKLLENEGCIFNNVNQTLDNTFYNLANLIILLKTEVLGGTAIDVLETTASQIRLSVSQVSGELQDIVVLVSGQVCVFLDKTTNSIVIISSIILLAIGLVIFVIIFLRKRGSLTAGPVVSLVLVGIYVLFFLSVTVITPLRAWMISGFDLGTKATAKTLAPKVTAIYPEKFSPGINDRIHIYGRHLNLIQALSVKLQQGSSVKKVFPGTSVITKTSGEILLGNLDKSSTGFAYVDFNMLKSEVLQKDPRLANNSHVENILNTLCEKSFVANLATFLAPIRQVEFTPTFARTTARVSLPRFKAVQPVYFNAHPASAIIIDDIQTGNLLSTKSKQFFTGFWSIAEGLYGLCVYDAEKAIEDTIALQIDFPDPPAPKPDISIAAMGWSGEPVVGRKVTPKLVLGFLNPKEIKKDFYVRVKSLVQTSYSTEFRVTTADVQSVSSLGLLTLYLDPYTPAVSGNHGFEVVVDSKNDIEEVNESNNRSTIDMAVKRFQYTASVAIQVFKPTKSYDKSEDEYRVSVTTYVNGSQVSSDRISKDGEPSNSWNVNLTHSYSVSPGDTIYVYTSGYEDDGDHWYDRNDDMGFDSDNHTIEDTGGTNVTTAQLILDADGYELRGVYTTTRTVVP